MEKIRKRKRITVRLDCPNPLFERWLIEWRDEAKRRESKMEHCFTAALRSLQKYPLPFETGKDCKVLRGFGDKLCKMLDEKLKEHNGRIPSVVCNTNVTKIPNISEKKGKLKHSSLKDNVKSLKIPRKEYVPQPGSGAFAILLALHKLSEDPEYVGYSSKLEITKVAQVFSDTSFSKPEPGSRYTAWSSMRTLLQKELVCKKSNPAKFSLTEEGVVLAVKLYSKVQEIANTDPSTNEPVQITASDTSTKTGETYLPNECVLNICEENRFDTIMENLASVTGTYSTDTHINPSTANKHSGSSHDEASGKMFPPKNTNVKHTSKTLSKQQSSSCVSQGSSTTHEEETVFLMPNEFDIILLVDTQETSGSRARLEDPMIVELKKLNVQFEVRHLKVGDYTWICRHNTSNYELVLPYIVERKRMDDLGHSIKDGRFHEQKFRLKQCGVQNLIYLIENYGNNQHAGLPVTTLYQAAINTMVQDEFVVKIVDNMHEAVSYLSCFTLLLNKYYKAKTLMSCPKDNLTPSTPEDDLIPLLTFKEFSKTGTKNKQLKVKDLFVRQLLQIKGMSVEKALAVVNVYHTPKQLRMAYSGMLMNQAEKLLSSIQFGKLKKNIGPVLSKTVFQLFSLNQF